MKMIISAAPNRVTFFLLKIVGFLIICGLLSNYLHLVLGYQTASGLVPLFNLDWECNVPAFYSAFAIWFSAALLWFIHLSKKKSNSAQASYWKALFFLYFSTLV